jgi:hypothetical protein
MVGGGDFPGSTFHPFLAERKGAFLELFAGLPMAAALG